MAFTRALRWSMQAQASDDALSRSVTPQLSGSAARDTVTSLSAIIGVAALWAICHPYAGLVGDARLYLGRDLANLDPGGLGRDLAFAYDGQSRFSVFQLVTTPLVAAMGVPRTSLLVALAANLCVFAAVLAFVQALATCLDGQRLLGTSNGADRLILPTLIVLAVLPTGYGDPGIFSFFETSAIPRPFAEAAVVAASAAALRSRWWRVGFLLVLAVLVHPIMAAVGVAGLIFFAAWSSKETLFAAVLMHRRKAVALSIFAAAAGAAALALAAAGREPFAHILERIDGSWWSLLTQRSPHLFPTLWTPDAYTRLAAQTTTMIVAAAILQGPIRRLAIVVTLASLGQLAFAAFFADVLHLRLATEIQLWRGLWLLGFMSGCLLVPCAAVLWRKGNASRVLLLLFVLLWLVQASLPLTLAVACCAIALQRGIAREAIRDRHVILAASCVVLLVLLWNANVYLGYVAFVSEWSSRLGVHLLEFVGNGLELLPVVAGLAIWALLFKARRLPDRLVICASCLLAVTALVVWDQRTPIAEASERFVAPPGLTRLVAGRPPEVLWLGGVAEPWFMLEKPQYFSPQQAVGMVFSRPLAMEWRRRADLLIGLGLVHPDVFTPWKLLSDDDRLKPNLSAIEDLCHRPGAPGMIVVPVRDDVPAIAIAGAITWPAAPNIWAPERRQTTEWHHVTGWTALPCASDKSAVAPPATSRGPH